MATTKNAGSTFLAAANPRLLNAANADILLATTVPIFHVNAAGTPDTTSCVITAQLISLDGTVTFSCTGGTLSSVSGNTAVLTYAAMTANTATVTAALSYRGATFTRSISISKVFDGSAVTTYTWIRYGDDASGAGISDSPAGKTYLGLGQNKTTATESANPADYSWSLISGTDGVPGTPGADGVTPYTWIKYSDVADGTGLYDLPTTNTLYMGIAVNKTTATESTVKTDYVWSKFKGDQGVPGSNGTNGTNGTNGSRGAGQYYTTGSAWDATVADAATPGSNVVDDLVTISNGSTYALTKRWDGSAWVNIGTVIDGNLLVTGSVGAAKVNANGLTIRKPDGTVILDASGGGLQAGFEAPNTKNPDDALNLVSKSRFEDGLAGSWQAPVVSVTGQVFTKAIQSDHRDVLTLDSFPVIPGETLYIEADIDASSSPYSVQVGVATAPAGGSGWTGFNGPGLAAGSGWTHVTGSFIVPAGSSYGIGWIGTAGSSGFGTVQVTNIRISRFQSGATAGATWGVNVGGSNKPADNATVGAPAGTNVGTTPATTVESNAANGQNAYNDVTNSTTGLNSRLRNNADQALGGIISVNAVTAPAGFRAGTLTWDNSGARTGGYGVAMTPLGLVGYNSSGTLMFSLSGSGLAVNGDISGSTGTFGDVTIGSTMSMGQSAYNTGAGGWFQGGATPKMSMKTASGASFLCDPANNILQFNGGSIDGTATSTVISGAAAGSTAQTTLASPVVGTGSGSNMAYQSKSTAGTLIQFDARTAVGAGGTGPYQYSWSLAGDVRGEEDPVYGNYVYSGQGTNTVVIRATAPSGAYPSYGTVVTCTILDTGSGRVGYESFSADATFF